MCTDALHRQPECAPLLLYRARAQVALGRELDATADLRDVVRIDPACSIAFRLLGELSARGNHHEAAGAWFREALRLDPGDREASRWLLLLEHAAARKPSPAVRFSDTLEAPAPLVIARGTRPYDDDDRPTLPFARGSQPARARQAPPPIPQPRGVVQTTISGPPPTIEPARPARRLGDAVRTNARIPELPGFCEYLVATGILTRERLRAAQAYQRSMRVELSTAIVTLGLATRQRIEWAAVAHQSQVSQDRQSIR